MGDTDNEEHKIWVRQHDDSPRFAIFFLKILLIAIIRSAAWTGDVRRGTWRTPSMTRWDQMFVLSA